jgi:hypothetical protein
MTDHRIMEILEIFEEIRKNPALNITNELEAIDVTDAEIEFLRENRLVSNNGPLNSYDAGVTRVIEPCNLKIAPKGRFFLEKWARAL